MSIAHPSLLALALASAALVWWLHRARSRGQSLHVPSLLLFQAIQLPTPLDPEPAPRTDPAWVRRAALIAALCLAMAGLKRDVASGNIVVWVDGSPSMLTLEGGVSRLERALAGLRRDLSAQDSVQVTVRSLARPDFVSHLASPFALDSGNVPRGVPLPPEAASLSRNAEQWVVTDGASAALAQWLQTAPVDHIVQAGTSTENVALVRLALRSALAAPGRSDVLVGLRNAGRRPASRRLELLAGTVRLPTSELTLLPGETRTVRFTVDATPTSLEARISPSDALSLDDSLTLSVPEPLVLRVAIDPDCGAPLVAALQANVAIERAEPARAQMLVDCSDRWRESALPRLHLRQSFQTRPLLEATHWNRQLIEQAAPLPPGLRTTAEQLPVAPEEKEVLSAGAHALIVLRTRPTRVVESILDLRDNSLAARSEYPLLIATLLDVTAGDELLGRVASAARAPESVEIAPHVLNPRHAESRGVQNRAIDLTPMALTLALLALLWEFGVSTHSLWQNRQYYLGRLE